MVAGKQPVKLPYPWIEGLTRVQQEQIYLDFQSVGGLGGTRWRTIVIAASNTLNRSGADYTCSGTSDQATINRAITDLEAHGSGASLGRIVLLEGTYNLDGQILIDTLHSRTLSIEGMGGNSQSDLGVPGTYLHSSDTSNPVFSCQGAAADPSGVVTIENIAMTNASSGHGIFARDMTIHVRNCRVINTGGTAIFQDASLGGCSNSIIEGNYLSGTSGVTLTTGPTRGTVSYVRNNTIITSGASTHGIQTGNNISSSPNYHISDNTIYMSSSSGTTGIGISGTSTQYNMVANNVIIGPVDVGISFAGFAGMVTGNYILNSVSGIVDGAFECDFAMIAGNFVQASTLGIRLGNTSSTRSTIMNNTITAGATGGPTTAVQIGASATDCGVFGNDCYAAGTVLSDSGTRTRTDSSILGPTIDTNARVAVRKNNAGSTLSLRRRLDLIEGTDMSITVSDDSGSEEADITFALPSTLAANARVGVRKNSTGSTSLRRRLNLIEGTNVTLTVSDDSVDEEVDITISAASGATGDTTGQIIANFDGGGSTISTGKIARIVAPFAGTLHDWQVMLDAADTTSFEVWKDVYANYPDTVADKISASAGPGTTATDNGASSSLGTWSTTTITAGDVFYIKIVTVGVATQAVVILNYTRP